MWKLIIHMLKKQYSVLQVNLELPYGPFLHLLVKYFMYGYTKMIFYMQSICSYINLHQETPCEYLCFIEMLQRQVARCYSMIFFYQECANLHGFDDYIQYISFRSYLGPVFQWFLERRCKNTFRMVPVYIFHLLLGTQRCHIMLCPHARD